ncbi:MAG: HD domain-containing phosphohydrolase, partial [Gammaproteobacteria bacterium]|nr:HD domain-containing phosphohydrolase [Gammaproteobacteria bacterium]
MAKLETGTLDLVERLLEIGTALSAEKDTPRLLEMILLGAKEITHADGGTLYRVTPDQQSLEFAIIRTDSLDIAMGGTSGNEITFPDLPLHLEDGSPNINMVAACAALERVTINIPDAYENTTYDFSGTRKFDESTGYRSRSFLTVPMANHENEVIGVLQLLNKIDPDSGEVVAFSAEDQRLVESLASQAAVALTNQQLIANLRELFESFIEMIASAIDDKSPYTGGHCRRVPELSMMLAEACARTREGPLASFDMSPLDRYELKIASWLHDCGKVTTPEYVVDKATKLETIYDRVHTIDTRFEVLKRDAEIELLRAKIAALETPEEQDLADVESAYEARLAQLDDDREFIRRANIGGEFMKDEDKARVREIAENRWVGPDGEEQAFLSENEVYNLSIERGTLTSEERDVINYHITATIKMLESLPFPKDLQRVPEFAGGHHEKMDGTGYPRGLKREEMSLQARIMGIADIFEALTAADRPYKKAKTLSESLRIMGFMKKDNHIDPDLFDVF